MSGPPESELPVDKRNEVCHSGDLILFSFKKGFCLRKDRDVFLFFGHPHKVTDILSSMKELRTKYLGVPRIVLEYSILANYGLLILRDRNLLKY